MVVRLGNPTVSAPVMPVALITVVLVVPVTAVVLWVYVKVAVTTCVEGVADVGVNVPDTVHEAPDKSVPVGGTRGLLLATEPLPSSINVTLMSGFPSQEVPLQIALHARPPHVLSEQRAIQLLNFVILIIMAQPIIHFC